MYKPTLLQVFEKKLSTKPFSRKWNLGKAEIMHQLFFSNLLQNFQWWQPEERVHNGWWGRLNSKRGFEAFGCQKSGHV
jgi:hypothetical protein